MIAPTTHGRVRSLAAVVAVVAISIVASTSTVDAALPVAPVPGVRVVASTHRVSGQTRLLLRSIEVTDLPGQEINILCNGCLRLMGPIRVTHPARGSVLYSGADWLVGAGRTVLISVYRPGEVGRYLRLAARLGTIPELVFSASGCLASFGHVEPCAAGLGQPPVGVPLPAAPSPSSPGTITVSTPG